MNSITKNSFNYSLEENEEFEFLLKYNNFKFDLLKKNEMRKKKMNIYIYIYNGWKYKKPLTFN